MPNPAPWRAEPLWRKACAFALHPVPSKYHPWMLDQGSLTQRVIGHCRGRFRVRVLDQRLARPLRSEAALLGLRCGTHAVIRRVQLLCADTPWVSARTVIPLRTLTGKYRRFRHLGARSLGATLFADPSLKRGQLEIACLTPADVLYHQVTQALNEKPPYLWGRRSLFRIGGRPLLVAEFFLPGIPDFVA